jgi:tRNA(Ile)-lysidine synthase
LLSRLTEESCRQLLEIHKNQVSATESCPERINIATHPFLLCHQALQRRILEKVCWMMLTRPGFRQIELIRTLIRDGRNGAELHLGGGLRIWKAGSDAVFSHPAGRQGFRGSGLDNGVPVMTANGPGVFTSAAHTLSVSLQTEKPGKLRDTELLLDADRISFPLQLRSPLPGERFRPLGATGRKKIHRFLTDAKIPRQDRRFFPVLVSEDRIIAIAGLRIDHDYRVRDDTRRFLLIDWRKP